MSCPITFLPQVSACTNNKCDSLCIKELTDVRQLPYKETGFGSPNPITSEITSATITFYDLSGVVVGTFIVKDGITDLYPNNTPTPFVLTDSFAWTQQDGIFQIVYEIIATPDGIVFTTYTNGTQHELFICNLTNCLDSLVVKAIKECDSVKLEEYKNLINQLELIIYGIQSAFSCGDFTTATNLIASGKTICDNLCDCGCGDC
jgi:hypothetical protein